MDIDRPHRSNSNNSSGSTSELFICFTSRLSSSSSMKISSKSILSPGRARDTSQMSLSNSLSRRLKNSGSMKGGQASPMFPTNGKKRGCAFENPEPSSPKVTCIGQVRVKTKKQGKKMRTRSKRRGEVSFRRMEQNNNNNNNNSNFEASSHQDYNHTHSNHQFLNHQQQQEHRNQRWVHFPVTICEALRTFGAEFNCFLPCRSSCMASQKEKEEKAAGSNTGSSCGAVFARWLVAVQDGDGKGREIELVVGEDEREENEEGRRSYRRHVFEELEFKEEKCDGGNESMQEEEARVSICIPPKNALLLMRCRSDPVKMAALSNKFWEAPVPQDEDEEDEEGEEDGNEEEEKSNLVVIGADEEGQRKVGQETEHTEDLMRERWLSCDTIGDVEHQTQETEAGPDHALLLEEEGDEQDSQERSQDVGGVHGNLAEKEDEAENEASKPVLAHEIPSSASSHEDVINPVILKHHQNEGSTHREHYDNQEPIPKITAAAADGRLEEEDDLTNSIRETSLYEQQEQESQEVGKDLRHQEAEPAETRAVTEFAVQESKEVKETAQKTSQVGGENTLTSERSECEDPKTQEGQAGIKSKEGQSQPLLPDCLLLMMCEPKLSMEVSKETWVCSTDFIRWLPEHSRPVNKTNGGEEPKKSITNVDTNSSQQPGHNNSVQQPPRSSCCYPAQPPRSSCSYPAHPPPRGAGTESISTMIEQNLAASKACEPFVLTRCKSEPMRTASKLAPEACFWKNRKLEPHGPTTLGVGAAGVGF